MAGGLRLASLGTPDRLRFDEVHYVPDAREYLDRGVEIDRPAHPPAGKWIMAASIDLVGDRAIGWRLPSAIAGVVTVAVTYLIGRRLFAPYWAALLAALFVALDGVALTMSRIGVLDSIQAAFVAAGAWCILRDRDGDGTPWRWASGVLFGLAVATKWSSFLPLLVSIGIAVSTELVNLRRSEGHKLRAWGRSLTRVALPLMVIPFFVYLATYAGWFANFDRSETGRERCGSHCTVVDAASGWAFEQWDMYDLQNRLKISHPDRSRPLAWVTLTRPVLIYAEGCPADPPPDQGCEVSPGTRARVLVFGNPALWWTLLAAVPVLVWSLWRRPLRATTLVVSAFVAVQLLPWTVARNPGFSYYLTPVVTFAALAVTQALVVLAERWRWCRPLPVLTALAIVGCATWLAPLWLGIELTPSGIDARAWLDGWR